MSHPDPFVVVRHSPPGKHQPSPKPADTCVAPLGHNLPRPMLHRGAGRRSPTPLTRNYRRTVDTTDDATFDWNRWWYPAEQAVPLLDGLLADPNTVDRFVVGPAINDLSSIGSHGDEPCLILLGDPGVGKTHELDEFVTSRAAASEHVARYDLGSFTDWASLDKEVFHSGPVDRWSGEGGDLLLVLDSLDEAATIPRLPEELVRALRQLDTGRLRLRIAGRPSVWPGRLTESLKEVWPSVQKLCLAPLTKTDVASAAELVLGAGNTFLADILAQKLGPLAASPITLRFLLSIVKTEGTLPSGRFDVYERGIRVLAAEHSVKRIDERTDAPSVHRRVATAETLATLSLLSGRPRVVRQVAAIPDAGSVAIAAIVDVTNDEAAGEAVWTSALLSGPSTGRTWVHRSIEEFLCAARLSQLPVDAARRLLALPFDPVRVTPQLAGVAVWLATSNDDIFRWVASAQPEILLTPDLGRLTPGQRRTVCLALLKELGEGQFPAARRTYKYLKYPELDQDLAPFILDGSESTSVRIEALQILMDNSPHGLDRKLVAMIEGVAKSRDVDSYDDEVRVSEWALAAMTGTEDAAVLGRLEQLALRDGHPRILRLAAVKFLASNGKLGGMRLLDAMRPFLGVTQQIDGAVSAQIRGAIRDNSLDRSDVVTWLLRHRQDLDPEGYASFFADMAAESLDAVVVNESSQAQLSEMSELIARCIQTRHQFPDTRFDDNDLLPDVRRELALGVLVVLEGGDFHAVAELANHGVIHDDDLGWWLELLAGEDIEGPRLRAAVLVVSSRPPTESNVAVASEKLLRHPVLASIVEERFGPETQDAWRANEVHWAEVAERNLEEERSRYFSPSRLTSAIATTDWRTVLWELSRPSAEDMQSHPRRAYRNGDPLTVRDTWRLLADSTKLDVAALATDYLQQASIVTDPFAIDAACAAYHLLLVAAPSEAASLPAATLEAWLPGALRAPEQNSSASQMLSQVAARNPVVAEASVLALLNVEPGGWIHVLDRLGDFSSPVVIDRILSLAGDPGTHHRAVGLLLDAGLTKAPDRSLHLARQIIARRGPPAEAGHDPDDENQTTWPYLAGVNAAVSILRSEHGHSALNDVLGEFRVDPIFAGRVVAVVGGDFGLFPMLPAASPSDLADFFLWALEALPPDPAFRPDRSNRPSPGQYFTDSVYRRLMGTADEATVEALDRIARTTGDGYHRGIARAARLDQLAVSWRPPPPDDVATALLDPTKFVITTTAQLAEMIVAALDVLQDIVAHNAGDRSEFWHRQHTTPPSWMPMDEPEISGLLSRRLEPILQRFVVRREVLQQPRLADQPGEQPDIEITAKLDDGSELVVPIEVKGSWHDEVRTAIQTQLADRYLTGPRGSTGIYVVAYLHGSPWIDGDWRREKATRFSIDDLRETLTATATFLGEQGFDVTVRVLDIRLGTAP
jgi:hypothetical protein